VARAVFAALKYRIPAADIQAVADRLPPGLQQVWRAAVSEEIGQTESSGDRMASHRDVQRVRRSTPEGW